MKKLCTKEEKEEKTLERVKELGRIRMRKA